jgi:hypothetical protein
MSHRITVNTEIKDRKLASKALAKKGWCFLEEGDAYRITTGPMSGSVINFSTGVVAGDTDLHSRDLLGALNQAYGEEEMLRRVESECGTIEERIVLGDGTVRLIVQA